MTPEAWRALRSRATRGFWITLGLILGAKGIQTGVAELLDVHLKSIPSEWAAILPTGSAMVSALIAYVGGHTGNKTDTYLLEPAIDTTAVEKPAVVDEPIVQTDGYAIGTSSIADGFTGGLEFAPDVLGGGDAGYVVDELGVPQPPGRA